MTSLRVRSRLDLTSFWPRISETKMSVASAVLEEAEDED